MVSDQESGDVRHAHYCNSCQMTVRVFTTPEGLEVGCHSECHRLPIEAFRRNDSPDDWRLENTPFQW